MGFIEIHDAAVGQHLANFDLCFSGECFVAPQSLSHGGKPLHMANRSGAGHYDVLTDDLDLPAGRLLDETVAPTVSERCRAICTNDDAVFAANTHNGRHDRWPLIQNKRCAYPVLTRL